ncbi:MAG: methylenetetrahydrofolate reductase [Actinobacteria bacterium]|nr:methylenetetrahydrofolate reductase [Actinomycetota bacterium]
MNPEDEPAAPAILEAPRFEVLPLRGVAEHAAHLPPAGTVTVTCSPTKGLSQSLRVTEELRGRGVSVVPHIAARLVSGPGHLRDIVRRLDGLGVRDVFVVGGDSKTPAGPYATGLDLLRALADMGHPFDEVGVPAYPEGHPHVPDDVLSEVLCAKQAFASYLVTQMCFDAPPILEWLDDARRRGVWLPAYIGLPGIVDRAKLLRISVKIGVGDSARFLKKNRASVARLVLPGSYSPEQLVRRLAVGVRDRDRAVRGYHLFTFTEVEATAQWARQQGALVAA